ETAVAPGVRQLWLFALIQRALAQAARQQPLLIVMEELQWADEASRELVATVTAQSANLPLLLLITFRPTIPFHFLALHQPTTSHITLANWSAGQARAVVQRRLSTGELPPLLEQRLGLRDQYGRESEQVNPLFLEESLKLMLAADVLHFGNDGRLRVDENRLAELPIPDTVAALLQTRLDALSAGAYSLLQVAAVIGYEFDLTLLTAVIPGMSQPEALDRLNELISADLVQTVVGGTQPVFMFQNSLLQEVVYRRLPYARRQTLHFALAERVATHAPTRADYPLLAHHYGQAEAHEEGLHYALAAAEDATENYTNRAAAGFYQQAIGHVRALGMEGRQETAVHILTAQATAHLRLGELEEAAKTTAIALDSGVNGSQTTQPALLNLLAEIGLAQARYPEAAALAAQVISQRATIPALAVAHAHQLAGQAAAAHQQWTVAENHLQMARTLLKSNGSLRPLPELLAAFGLVRSQQGTLPRAAELCQHAVDSAQQFALPIPMCTALLALAQVRLRQGRAREAVQVTTEGVELARAVSPRLLAQLLLVRVEAFLVDGRSHRP
ncbi:MAG: hypothetical protein HC804_12920, partial [Anaerolineae bacterium]|nr:hypothetical protein [Anaerolineae bacterium]